MTIDLGLTHIALLVTDIDRRQTAQALQYSVLRYPCSNAVEQTSILWVLSTIVGVMGYFIPGLNLLFVTSGVVFGIGFAGAGMKVWSATSNSIMDN